MTTDLSQLVLLAEQLQRSIVLAAAESLGEEGIVKERFAKAWGPYRLRPRRWKVVLQASNGRRTNRHFRSESAARAWIALHVDDDEAIKVQQALVDYREYMHGKGNKPSSVRTTLDRLSAWLPGDGLLCYADVEAAHRRRAAQVAADTARNELAEVKTFFRWCVKQGWLRSNPAEGIEPQGRRRRGKAQLRGAEAKLFSDYCMWLYKSGQRGYEAALGCLLALWLGLRSGEICRLEARDVDVVGEHCWLWIADGKTAASRRQVEVPAALREMLVTQSRGAGYLFPASSTAGHRDRTWLRKACARICTACGVPVVSPHGLRGTHATLARSAGASGHVVAAQLGHTSERVTEQHYLAPGTLEAERVRRGLKVLQGGK